VKFTVFFVVANAEYSRFFKGLGCKYFEKVVSGNVTTLNQSAN